MAKHKVSGTVIEQTTAPSGDAQHVVEFHIQNGEFKTKQRVYIWTAPEDAVAQDTAVSISVALGEDGYWRLAF